LDSRLRGNDRRNVEQGMMNAEVNRQKTETNIEFARGEPRPACAGMTLMNIEQGTRNDEWRSEFGPLPARE